MGEFNVTTGMHSLFFLSLNDFCRIVPYCDAENEPVTIFFRPRTARVQLVETTSSTKVKMERILLFCGMFSIVAAVSKQLQWPLAVEGELTASCTHALSAKYLREWSAYSHRSTLPSNQCLTSMLW